MIDILLKFADRATARKEMKRWWVKDDDGKFHWVPKKHCGINKVKVIIQEAVYNFTDPENPIVTTPQKTANGYWLCISIPDKDTKGFRQNRHKKMIADFKKTTGFKRRFTRPAKRRKLFKDAMDADGDKMTASEKAKFIRFEPVPAGGQYQ